jgi:hypothetical protein
MPLTTILIIVLVLVLTDHGGSLASTLVPPEWRTR